MTIGKNSRKSSARGSIRAPKFLDKSSGFYGRLDEPEAAGDVEEEVRGNEVEGRASPGEEQVPELDKAEAFDLSEGMMEGDGETLLRRKPSRRSSRWRRSSRRKPKEDAARDEGPGVSAEAPADPREDPEVRIQVEIEKAGGGRGPVHFAAREEADDQVLIRDKKRGREEEEGEEERRMKMEQEEGMKVVKRNAVKNYRKALDRAFRRGWETFIANLYSVTLTPVTSSSPPSSSPSSEKKLQHSLALAEFR